MTRNTFAVPRSIFLISALGVCGTAAAADIEFGAAGLEVATDGYRLGVGGRVQLDAAVFDTDRLSSASGVDARRLWVEVDVATTGGWSLGVAYDFANHVTQDAFVRYKVSPAARVTMGQFKPQVGLSEQSSNNYLTFTERATVIRALAPGRALGIGFNTWSPHATFSIAAYGDAIDAKSSGGDPLRLTSRVVFRPVVKEQHVLHFGTSFLYQETDDDRAIRWRARPVVSLPGTEAVLEASLEDIGRHRVHGFEAAWSRKSLSIQGEYLRADIDRPGTSSVDGFYVQATLFANRAMRNYLLERGTFGRPKFEIPQSAVWEVGVRYDRFDMADVGAGTIRSLAVAVNRHFAGNLKLAVTAGYSDIDDGATSDGSVAALQARLQWVF